MIHEDIEYELDNFTNFIDRLHSDKRKRYNTLDKNQINLWERYEHIEDGFFTKYKNNHPIPELFKQVQHLTTKYGYK